MGPASFVSIVQWRHAVKRRKDELQNSLARETDVEDRMEGTVGRVNACSLPQETGGERRR